MLSGAKGRAAAALRRSTNSPDTSKTDEKVIKFALNTLDAGRENADAATDAGKDAEKEKCGSKCKSFAKRIIENKWFDRTVLLFISFNCIFLMIANPIYPANHPIIRINSYAEYVFAAVFTAEMIAKMVGLGICGYAADHWNKLDFIIVIGGYLNMHPSFSNITAIRVLRVLRPLRSLSHMEGLKVLTQTLLSSLVGLLDVLLLIMFLFIIFSIIFLQLFKGKLHQQCYHNVTVGNSTVEQWVDVDGLPKFCNVEVDVRGPGGIPCSAHAESEGWVCGTEISCVESMDPLAGLRSFDNIGLALLNVYIVVTMAGWTDLLYAVQHTSGFATSILFVILICLVSFFAVNLMLAVITQAFSDAAEETEQLKNHKMTAEEAYLLICKHWFEFKRRQKDNYVYTEPPGTRFIETVLNTVVEHHTAMGSRMGPEMTRLCRIHIAHRKFALLCYLTNTVILPSLLLMNNCSNNFLILLLFLCSPSPLKLLSSFFVLSSWSQNKR